MAQSNMKDPKAISGKTVLLWLVCFFGVIFTVNGIFLYLALGSFPGVVVESSYKAGQAYNSEIAAAKAQAELNWQVSSEFVDTGDGNHELQITALDAEGAPIYGVEITAALRHPAQENADVEVLLHADGGGRYRGALEEPHPGSWNLVLEIRQDGTRKFKSENRVFLKN